jgi:protein involved in polysaccharide export with SLBB domain
MFALARLRLLPLFLVLAACMSSEPDKRILQYLNTDGFGNRYTGNAEEENYVTIGDSVNFADSYHAELKGVGQVDLDGTIMVPEAGPVHVAGLTRSEIEGLLTQKLSPYYTETDIRVLISATKKVYYVIGEVGAWGPRPFTGDITIMEAVMMASPGMYTANLGRVQLIRADPRDPFILEVDVADMLYTGDSTFNVHVQERDILYVPPTILKQIADFISSLIVPFTTALSAVWQSLFLWDSLDNGIFYGGYGYGGGGYKGGYGGGGGGGGLF